MAVLAVAALLRAPITSVPPALPSLRADLHLGPALAGATTSLPLMCFGIFAFTAPFVVRRLGLERTMLALLVPMTLGIAVRSTGGAALFFVGTVLVGVGIAVGNVLVPSFIRYRFPAQVALLMGLYTAVLQLSGAAGSALTAPLEVDLGWGWAPALLVWAVPAAAVLAWWAVLVHRAPPRQTGTLTPPSGFATVARAPLTWLITAFMGLQSLVFYSIATWLPDQLMAQGWSASVAGVVLGLLSLLGLPGAFLAPHHATSGHAPAWIAGVFGAQIVGVLCLQLGPAPAVVGALVCGVAQGGAFSTALTFIADQPRSADVPALSAIAQGTGYVLAAAGPVVVGAIYGAAGTWVTPNLALVGVLVVLIALGSVVGPTLRRAKAAAGR